MGHTRLLESQDTYAPLARIGQRMHETGGRSSKSVDNNLGHVFFCTWSPAHFHSTHLTCTKCCPRLPSRRRIFVFCLDQVCGVEHISDMCCPDMLQYPLSHVSLCFAGARAICTCFWKITIRAQSSSVRSIGTSLSGGIASCCILNCLSAHGFLTCGDSLPTCQCFTIL